MQVSVETTSGLERRLTIGVPAAQVDSEVDTRLKQAAKNVRMDGFRPGKVPMKVVKRRYGPGVRQEVVGEVIQKSFNEAVIQESLIPAGQPSIEPKNLEPGADLEFVATFEVYPEVELADFSGISVERKTATIGNDDVNEMIETLQKQRATWEESETAAVDADRVNINFAGTIDGEAFEGGTAEGHNLVLGSSSMIPGFEDGLEGKKAGEEVVLDLEFPETYHAEEIAGKAVQFKITVNSVSKQKMPELNAEFFAAFGVTADDETKFREDVTKNMERELAQAVKNNVKNQIMDGLIEVHELEVPKALAQGEINRQRQMAAQQFGQGIDPNQLPEELFKDKAERSVTLGLIVGEIVKKHEVSVDEDRVRTMVEDMAQSYQEPQQVIDWYYSNQEQLQQIRSAVLEDQVVEKVLESITVTESESTYNDVITAAAGNSQMM